MTESKICTCPSGDGSLRWPCPAHPAEQAGGDERAAFELFVRKHCGMPAHIAVNWDAKFTNDAWEGWKARAALAQPSPKCATCGGTGMVDDGEITCSQGGIPYENGPVKCVKDCPDCKAQPSPAQAEQAEAERPEGPTEDELEAAGLGYPLHKEEAVKLWYSGFRSEVITVLEAWEAIGHDIGMNPDKGELLDSLRYMLEKCEAHDAALARVAELERQQPVAWMHDQPNRVDVIHRDVKDLLQRVPGSSRGIHRPLDVSEHYTIPLYAAPVAQAQHSVPEVSGIGRDFAYPRSVVLYLRTEPTDDDLRAIHDGLRSLAAAPGKEVPQAWLDVQAERRRQITAEGWTPDHDDLYCAAELPRAAAAYILSGANDEAPAIWPFSAKWWKPRDARANYMRAGALILAEIERLDRAAAAGKEVGHE
ncbi:hypothetical protein [Pseudomonas aeruginosa]|uniref:hypothetical protein n=1 Tax=Pseudomonas aeruginosa TaxID=287 RepID=UPI0032B621C0